MEILKLYGSKLGRISNPWKMNPTEDDHSNFKMDLLIKFFQGPKKKEKRNRKKTMSDVQPSFSFAD